MGVLTAASVMTKVALLEHMLISLSTAIIFLTRDTMTLIRLAVGSPGSGMPTWKLSSSRRLLTRRECRAVVRHNGYSLFNLESCLAETTEVT